MKDDEGWWIVVETRKSLERERRERRGRDRFFEAQTEFDGIRVLKRERERDLKICNKRNDSFLFLMGWDK